MAVLAVETGEWFDPSLVYGTIRKMADTGKPVIAGTRITVEHIPRCLAEGDSVEHILQNHPHITAEDILAAQA
jgi:uncharacterized protein (DUF433 family)